MKKVILISLFVLSMYLFYSSNKKETIIIPDTAIRFRILANSNTTYDQNVKLKVKNRLEKELFYILSTAKNSKESEMIIKSNMDNIENIIKKELKNEEYSYNVDYGMHYFPKKEYKGVTYKEGEYKSLLITLGKGEGNNFWCVLFPPLCMMETEETTEVEYKFLIKETLEKYF